MRIYKRISDVTGLDIETAEGLQVASYSIGGHYRTHYDFFFGEDLKKYITAWERNRIATWLFYASDVELGGATVFPLAEAIVFPKKGSAAFWYNLHRNGDGDQETLHGACPVLVGTKLGWLNKEFKIINCHNKFFCIFEFSVSNIWIREGGQEFKHPCSTDPNK